VSGLLRQRASYLFSRSRSCSRIDAGFRLLELSLELWALLRCDLSSKDFVPSEPAFESRREAMVVKVEEDGVLDVAMWNSSYE